MEKGSAHNKKEKPDAAGKKKEKKHGKEGTGEKWHNVNSATVTAEQTPGE